MKKISFIAVCVLSYLLLVSSLCVPKVSAQSTQQEDVEIIKNGDTIFLGKKIVHEPNYTKVSRYRKSNKISFPQFEVPSFMKAKSFDSLVNILIYSGLSIAFTVVLLSAVHGGLLWIHADGDVDIQEKAKTKLVAVTIGALIIVLGFGIQKALLSLLRSNQMFSTIQTKTTLSRLELIDQTSSSE